MQGSRTTTSPSSQAPSTPGKSPKDTSRPSPAPENKDTRLSDCLNEWDGNRHCFRKSTEPSPEPAAAAPAPFAITITDLAQFAPEPPTLTTEPATAGIAGTPTNFLTTATPHTRTGTLFHHPLTIHFTPTHYTYDYGDTTTLTLTTPARTWNDLTQPDFTPTPTSHTYTHRGTYTTTVTTHWTATIDLGTGPIPIPGELTTTSPPHTLTIYEAHTALVTHTCTEQPTAPGC
ncbi:hypothetical protein [Microbacterium sp. XT11]|uniref:hypothetical protein n=1 Tax=Microbacterium sp. XT11 TaxID=367477 RepID=UPI0012F83700|nr:hypothetical protein [Microbacterium sp. XT11]